MPGLTALYCGASLDVCASVTTASWTPAAFAAAMALNLCTFQPYNLLQVTLRLQLKTAPARYPQRS